MVTLITSDNINELMSLSSETLWVPVLSDQKLHHTQNRVSSVYIYDLQKENEYMVGFHSVDMDNVDFDWFMDQVPVGRRFCYNRKYMKTHKTFIEADLMVWYFNGKAIEVDQETTRIFRIYRSIHKGLKNINDVIPIMRILEYCREVRNQFILFGADHIREVDRGFVFYDDVYLPALQKIEEQGIRVDEEEFKERYHRDTESIVYTEYNPYTLTGRPSSRFGGINFNSLNKSDGSRRMIISRFKNGRLFETDYDSYHIRLIGNIIGYEFPEGNLHEYFAKIYFETDQIDEDLYEKSKRITFKQLYGEVEPEYEHIEFFRKIQEFLENEWQKYESLGYFTSPLSGRKFRKEWFDKMSTPKMFNYIIQCYESELNAMVLEDILQYLYQRNSKVIMYTYDAILIDYDPNDGIEVMKGIKERMTKFGYPVHVKAGINYNDMIDVTIG